MKLLMKLIGSSKGSLSSPVKTNDGRCHSNASSITVDISEDIAKTFTSSSSSLSPKPKKKKSKQRKSKRSSSRSTSPVPLSKEFSGSSTFSSTPLTPTPNKLLVAKHIEDLNKGASSETLLSYYVADNVKIRFEDTPSIPSSVMVMEMQKLYKSFPNIHFGHESIKEDKEGHVIVDEMKVTGTHTGEAYGFANFPQVPTSNKHCINDPELMMFTIKDGKFVMMEVIALGATAGPPGFYTTIGGNMDTPPTAEDQD